MAIIRTGELEARRASGDVRSICGGQIARNIPESVEATEIAISDEPLWSIGSGHMPNVLEIPELPAHIRPRIARLLGWNSSSVRIPCGGSVKPDDAAATLAVTGLGAVIVGGAGPEAIFRAVAQDQPNRTRQR